MELVVLFALYVIIMKCLCYLIIYSVFVLIILYPKGSPKYNIAKLSAMGPKKPSPKLAKRGRQNDKFLYSCMCSFH